MFNPSGKYSERGRWDMWKRVIGVVAVLGFCAGAAVAGETAIEKDARVYIIWPKDGQVIPELALGDERS